MSRNCTHKSRKNIIEYHGLQVDKCQNCNYVLPINPLKATIELHRVPQRHLEHAREEIADILEVIDLYLKTNVSGDKYEFWRNEVVGKVKWSLKFHKVGKNTYLALHIIDLSMTRISHVTAKGNRDTMRTLGNVTNLPDVGGLLFQMSLYNGWRKIERFLDDVVRAQ